MAAKGIRSKTIIFNKLQEDFPNAFWEEWDKILRIPFEEDGNYIEIKVTLTAPKNTLGDDAVASAFTPSTQTDVVAQPAPAATEITEEEKERVAQLLSSLGL